ncbi:MAG: hypothetical protein AAB834_06685, partial [Patescibacteria group bacterium]
MRDKRRVAELVTNGQPFVYTSGKYPSEFEKTTVAFRICDHPQNQGSFVYDLRHDPTPYKDLSPEQLVELWRWKKEPQEPRLPIKTLQYNRCPAVAPLGVLDEASRQRLGIDLAAIKNHLAILKNTKDLEERLYKAWEIMENNREQTRLVSTEQDVDSCMYDGFFDNQDKQAMRVVRAAVPEELADLGLHFHDQLLLSLLPLYKARNYPKALTTEERADWERFCEHKLLSGGQHSRMALFFARLQEVATRDGLTDHQRYLLEELRLYAESIMPSSVDV